MELENKFEQEALTLIGRMSEMDAKSDDYKTMLERLRTVQQILSEETKRNNSLQEVTLATKRLEADKDKTEVEDQRTRLNQYIEEEKLKQQKLDKIWQGVLEVLKGLVFVGANAAIITLGIMANNSGEVLPQMVTKLINGVKLK